ncbi:MAG: hypothetical protein K9L70_07940 [Thiohalocapsa sp.]|nr:hypothetical protein [Thiohalocapsa sp.]MCF7991576.1 hypothetical protein [Thiohalocapsa sp.]
MDVKSELVSQAEYARRRGVGRSSVQRAIQSGRLSGDALVKAGQRVLIRPDAADAQWIANAERVRTPPPAATVDSHDIARARAKREFHEANLAELREARTAGALVDRRAIEAGATEVGAAFRQSIENLLQLAPELAAESDPARVRSLLDERIRAVLTDAADRLDALAATTAPEDSNHDA